MKDGKTLRGGDGRYEIVYSLGICSLEVAACDKSHAGKYTCVAENSQGTQESTCQVTVNGTKPVKFILNTACFNTTSGSHSGLNFHTSTAESLTMQHAVPISE